MIKLSELIRNASEKYSHTRSTYVYIDDEGKIYACALGMAALEAGTDSREIIESSIPSFLVDDIVFKTTGVGLRQPLNSFGLNIPDGGYDLDENEVTPNITGNQEVDEILATTTRLHSVIIGLNDQLRWTPLQIANWLEKTLNL